MNLLDILGTIGFEWKVALVNLVSFLIIFFILKRFVFDHLTRLISERREKIAIGLDNAQEAESVLRRAQETATAITGTAQQEAYSIVAASKGRAEEVAEKISIDAQKSAEQLVQQARNRGEADVEQMRKELKKEVATIIVSAVGKITQEDMNAQKQSILIGRAIKIIAQR